MNNHNPVWKSGKWLLNLSTIITVLTGIIFPLSVLSQSTNDYEVCLGSVESYWIQTPGGGSTFIWTISPGSSGTEWTIIENNNDSIQVQWSALGTYTIQVVETSVEGCDGNPISLTIMVTPAPTPADAGPDQSICGLLDATMNGNTAIVGTGSWSVVSGPGSVTFGDLANPLSSIAVTDYGDYILRWSISNGVCPESTDEVMIRFSEKPVTNGIWHN